MTSLKKAHRFGAFAGDYSFQKIGELSKQHKVSQAGLLEVLVLGLEAEGVDLGPIMEKGKARRKEVNPDLRRQRSDMISRLNKLPKDRLEAMLAEADAVAGDASK